jgi:hypothetical protein
MRCSGSLASAVGLTVALAALAHSDGEQRIPLHNSSPISLIRSGSVVGIKGRMGFAERYADPSGFLPGCCSMIMVD